MRGRISNRLARILQNEESRKQLINVLTKDQPEGVVEVNQDHFTVSKVIPIPLPVENPQQEKTTKAEN